MDVVEKVEKFAEHLRIGLGQQLNEQADGVDSACFVLQVWCGVVLVGLRGGVGVGGVVVGVVWCSGVWKRLG